MIEQALKSPNISKLATNFDPFTALEIEQSILGAILLDNKAFYNVANIINVNDFSDVIHQLIFKKMSEEIPKNKVVNALCLRGCFKNELPESDFNSINGQECYFSQLAQCVVTIKNVEDYARILRKTTVKRMLNDWLAAASNDNKTSVFDRDPAETIRQLEDKLFKLASRQLDYSVKSMGEQCDESIEWLIKRSETGLKTGIESLDNITGTWSSGDFVILGALTGMGKTALACTLVRNWCEAGKRVAFFSMEMTRNQLLARLAQTYDKNIYKKPGDHFSEKLMGDTYNAYQALRSFNLNIFERRRSIAEIRAILRQQQMKHGLDVIVVDYLGLIKPANEKASKYEQASQISTDLKGLALDFNVPLLSLCQMNREAAKDDKPPRVSELRDSGQIEQDADLILLLHRKKKGDQPDPDDFNGDKLYQRAMRKWEKTEEGTEIIIGKSRHWLTGSAAVNWTGTRYISATLHKDTVNYV